MVNLSSHSYGIVHRPFYHKFPRSILPELLEKARDTGDYSILNPENLYHHPDVDKEIRLYGIKNLLESVLDTDELNAALRSDAPILPEDLKPRIAELFQTYQEIGDVRILRPKYATTLPIPFRRYIKILSELGIPARCIADLKGFQTASAGERRHIPIPSKIGLSPRMLNAISRFDPVWVASVFSSICHRREFQSLYETGSPPPQSQEDTFVFNEVTKYLCAYASVEANTEIPVPETNGIIEIRWEQFLKYFKEKTQQLDSYRYDAVTSDLQRTLALFLHDSIQTKNRHSEFMHFVGIKLAQNLKERIPNEIFLGDDREENAQKLARHMMKIVCERKGSGQLNDTIDRISVLDAMQFVLLLLGGRSKAVSHLRTIMGEQEEYEQLVARTPCPIPPSQMPYTYC